MGGELLRCKKQLGHHMRELASGIPRRHELREDIRHRMLGSDGSDPEGRLELPAVGEQRCFNSYTMDLMDEGDGEGKVLGGHIEVGRCICVAEVAEVGGHEDLEAVEGSIADVRPSLGPPADPKVPLLRREMLLLLLVVMKKSDGVEDDVADRVREAEAEAARADAALQLPHLLQG